MTVKSTVSFTDKHHQFAVKKVEEGAFASVSSIVAAGLERMMQDEQERDIALQAMKQVIEQRMQTPDEEWVDMDAGDSLFDDLKNQLAK